jgi:probable HAF family extracellular repeat protein
VLPILVLALLSGYTCQEIGGLPDCDTPGRMYVTEKGIVAGCWYRFVPPGHVGDALAKPFVWIEGKTTALPLGTAKYGRVDHADDKRFVGDADGTAVMWTPDEKEGWHKPHLTELCKNGRGVFSDDEGRVYVQCDNVVRIWEQGSLRDMPMNNLQLVGIDRNGRWFANKYEGGFPGNRLPSKTFVWEKKAWRSLNPPDWELARFSAVNRDGVAVGECFKERWRAAIWDEAGLRELPSDKGNSSAEAINDHKQVVGFACFGKTPHAALWDNGRLVDLSEWLPDPTVGRAISINNAGSIVVTGSWDGERAYLLIPRR